MYYVLLEDCPTFEINIKLFYFKELICFMNQYDSLTSTYGQYSLGTAFYLACITS